VVVFPDSLFSAKLNFIATLKEVILHRAGTTGQPVYCAAAALSCPRRVIQQTRDRRDLEKKRFRTDFSVLSRVRASKRRKRG
jgi:hypothetical protein